MSSANQNNQVLVDVAVSQASIDKMVTDMSTGVLKALNEAFGKGFGAQSSSGGGGGAKNFIKDIDSAKIAADKLNESIQANQTSLESLQTQLHKNGLDLVEVEKKTAQYDQSLKREIVSHQQLQEMLQESNVDYQKVNTTIGQLSRSTDTLAKRMALVDPEKAGTLAKWQKADQVFKNLSFSIGLVGYGMENLGRRFLGFSEILFSFVKTSATATESLERMRNALIVEGKSDQEADSIEKRLRVIADLPGAKLDVVAKGFREIKAAGLDAEATLNLLQGLTKATAFQGTGPEGLTKAVDILRDALNAPEKPFKTQGVRQLERSLGESFTGILTSKFGGMGSDALNKVGADEVVKVITEHFLQLKDALPVTADRLNRIENSFTKIRQELEVILGPSLDKALNTIHAIEDLVTNLVRKFQELPEGKKNFISGLVGVIPLAIAALGGLLSVLGVLTVSVAVLGRTYNLLTQGLVKLGMMQVTQTAELAAQKIATDNLTAATIRLNVAKGATFRPSGVPIGLSLPNLATGGSAEGLMAAGGANTLKGALAAAPEIPAGAAAGFASIPAMSGVVATETAATTTAGVGALTAVAGPLAIVAALIASYTLNLGSARDMINSAFGGLIDSLGKLYDSLQKLLDQKAVQTFLATLKDLVNIVGGSLGTVFSTIIFALKDVVDSLTKLFDLISNPSWSGFVDFLNSFSRALVGWVDNLAKGITAAFADALADFAERNHIPGAGTLRGVAQKSRDSMGHWGTDPTLGQSTGLFKPGNFLTEVTADNIEKARVKQQAFNSELLKTQNILADMDIGAQKLVTSISNMQLSIERAKAQAALSAKVEEEKTALGQAIKLDPDQGSKDIPKVTADVLADAKTKIKDEFTTALNNIKPQVQEAFDSLVTALKSPNVGAIQAPGHTDLLSTLFLGSKEMADYIAKGGQNLDKILELSKKAADIKFSVLDGIGQSKDADAVLNDIKARRQAFDAAITAYSAALTKYTNDTNAAKVATDKFQKSQEDAAEALKRKNEALEKAGPLEKQIAELTQKIQALDMRAGAIRSVDQMEADRKERESLVAQISTLQEQVDNLKGEPKGKTENIIAANAKAVRDVTDPIKNADAATKAWTSSISELNQIISQGMTALSNYRAQLDAINDQRAAMGLSPLATGITSKDLGTTLGQDLAPGIAQARRLGDTTSLGSPLAEGGNLNTLQRYIDRLEAGQELLTKDIDVLNALGGYLAKQFSDLKGSAVRQQVLTDAAKDKLDTGDKTGAGFQANTEAYQKELRDQTSLNQQVAFYGKLLETQSGLLKGNVTLISAGVKLQQDQNKADLFNLGILQEKLSLEKQLLDIQESNRTNPANPNYNPADTAGADKNIDEQIANQKELIQAQADATRIGYRGKIQELEALPKQTDQVKEQIQQYKTLETTLAQVTSAKLGALDLSVGTEKVKAFSDAISGLADSLKSKGLFNLAAALKAIATGFDINGAKISKGAATLKGVGDTLNNVVQQAFTGFFTGMAKAMADWISGTDTFLNSLRKFLGSLLFELGNSIVMQAQGAVAKGALDAGIKASPLGPWAAIAAALSAAAELEVAYAPFTAIGAGLMVAGTLMGGGGTAAQTSNANAGNAANTATGATGAGFDPNTDPKTMYAREMETRIILDIRADDGIIVKKVIKAVNSNGRLQRLIGNKALGFG